MQDDDQPMNVGPVKQQAPRKRLGRKRDARPVDLHHEFSKMQIDDQKGQNGNSQIVVVQLQNTRHQKCEKMKSQVLDTVGKRQIYPTHRIHDYVPAQNPLLNYPIPPIFRSNAIQ